MQKLSLLLNVFLEIALFPFLMLLNLNYCIKLVLLKISLFQFLMLQNLNFYFKLVSHFVAVVKHHLYFMNMTNFLMQLNCVQIQTVFLKLSLYKVCGKWTIDHLASANVSMLAPLVNHWKFFGQFLQACTGVPRLYQGSDPPRLANARIVQKSSND